MADDQLQVELVAADRTVWSGQARMVLARTTEGDIGVMRNHAPVLSLLVPGVIEIRAVEGDDLVAAVDGGFISIANNRVSILSEHTELAHEIDAAQARTELEEAQADFDDEDAPERARRAEARVRAAEKVS